MMTLRAGAGIGYRLNGRETRPVVAAVCPVCQQATVTHRFMTPDGLWLATHRCPQHGDVVPNGCTQWGEVSGATAS